MLNATKSLTPKLNDAVARSAEGTNTGHENGEAMASVGVRVEPPVSPGDRCGKLATKNQFPMMLKVFSVFIGVHR